VLATTLLATTVTNNLVNIFMVIFISSGLTGSSKKDLRHHALVFVFQQMAMEKRHAATICPGTANQNNISGAMRFLPR
jgi:hypothetical protein